MGSRLEFPRIENDKLGKRLPVQAPKNLVGNTYVPMLSYLHRRAKRDARKIAGGFTKSFPLFPCTSTLKLGNNLEE